jgi:transposase
VILFGDEVSFAMWGSLGRTWGIRGQQPEVKTTGIRKGLKMFGAIGFFEGEFEYMESLAYCLKSKSLKQLKEAGLPIEVVKQLKSLKNQQYKTKEIFIQELQRTIGANQTNQYLSRILQYTQTAGKFNGETYIEFLKQLLNRFSSRIILIEDGASYHGSSIVKQFVQKHHQRLTVHRLPAFSPDFNPIEKLWKNTKAKATHLKYFKTFEQLRESVITVFKKYLEDATKVICVMKKLRTQAGLEEFIQKLTTPVLKKAV